MPRAQKRLRTREDIATRTDIEQMDARLSKKHKLSPEDLYPALRHANFHKSFDDAPEWWTIGAYASFSGECLSHKLGCEQLKALLEDFDQARAALVHGWPVAVGFIAKLKAKHRSYENASAVAHRYACQRAGDYIFPDNKTPDLKSKTKFEQLDSYVNYVMSLPVIANKFEKLAAKRHINDLKRSYGLDVDEPKEIS